MTTIRPAGPADVPAILGFIKELADYEHLSHQVTATEALLHEHLFGPKPAAEALIGFIDNHPAGYALYFTTFSTFLAKPGIFLEDLYVQPAHRGHGLGKALLIHLAQLAVARNCGRLEWSVLDWNAPSIAFYKSLGAAPLDDWTMMRVTGDALTTLAQRTT